MDVVSPSCRLPALNLSAASTALGAPAFPEIRLPILAVGRFLQYVRREE